VLSPAPPPLRSARAPFDASSSSIEQRPCEIRPDTASPADDTSLTGRGRLIGLEDNLGVTTAEPATEVISVAGAAPARVIATPRHICDAPCAGWLTVHARRHQREVCPLSRGVMSQPLSAPLQVGIRFLPPPLPATPSAHLATRFPKGRATGLPRCVAETAWVRSRPYAGGSTSAPDEFEASGPGHLPFWSKPVSTFGLFLVTTLQRFTWVDHTTPAGPQPPWCWQSQHRLALLLPPRRMRVRCAEGFAPPRCQERTPR
jgi:hypothetical protein